MEGDWVLCKQTFDMEQVSFYWSGPVLITGKLDGACNYKNIQWLFSLQQPSWFGNFENCHKAKNQILYCDVIVWAQMPIGENYIRLKNFMF